MNALKFFLRERWFSIDHRSLGLFRIAFGLCLIGNLYGHAAGGNLVAFFSNDGVLSNHFALFAPIQERPWSLLFAFSRPGEVAVAFVGILIVYVLYAVGWKTRLMQILGVVCLVSIANRNLLLQDGGSFVCCVLAVWTLFLPLGARFSIDAWLAATDTWTASDSGAEDSGPPALESRVSQHVSFVCFALLLQLAVIYAFNAAHKTGDTWRNGTAVHYVLWQLSRNTAIAGFLRLHEPRWFSPVLTRATLLFEWGIPVLVLIPVFQTLCRRIAIGAIWMFHLGIAALMSLGSFSYAMMAFSILLLRPADWESLKPPARRVRQHLDRWVGRLPVAVRRWILGFRHRFRPVAQVTGRGVRVAATAVLREGLAMLLFVAMFSELTLANPVVPARLRWESRPAWMGEMLFYLRLYETWNMFSPDVPTNDAGIVVDAVLADGTRIDPLTQKAPDFDAPLHGSYGLDHDWSEYVFYYPWERHRIFRAGLRDYILSRIQTRGWPPDKRVLSFDIYRVSADCPPPGEAQPRNVQREAMISYVAAP